MANIETRKDKNGKISYRVKIRLKGCPPQSATFESKTKAKNWASKTETKIRDGKYSSELTAKNHTVEEMIDRYIKSTLPQKPKVAYEWEKILNVWKKLLGNYTLFDCTPKIIVKARDEIYNIPKPNGDRKSQSTVNRYLTALSSVFGIAVKEWEWLEVNPMLRVSKLEESKARVRYLTKPEIEILLNACKKANNPYLYPAVKIAVSTGARKMEILGLKWEDIDLSNKRATLQDTKNGERRTIPLVGEVYEAMQTLYMHRKSKVWVFPSLDGTKPFDITRSWRNALKEANITDFRFHDLRHTTASHLAMKGVSMGTIADIVGHKTMQMVKRYSHLSDEHKKSVIEELNKDLFGDE